MGVVIFEAMQAAQLFPEHNQMSFYTWGDNDCCLPKGATEATLLGTLDKLQPGDVLIFQEVVGPQTGNPADADMRHRCAVRLTRVTRRMRKATRWSIHCSRTVRASRSPPPGRSPRRLPKSSGRRRTRCRFRCVCRAPTLTRSRRNRQCPRSASSAATSCWPIMAEAGGHPSGTGSATQLFLPPNPAADRCQPTAAVPLPVRYRPLIPDSPITQAVTLQLAGSPVTPGIVHLLTNSFVTLDDANGLVALTVQAASPLGWPHFFGVVAQQNAGTPANFDLSIVYNPPGGAPG